MRTVMFKSKVVNLGLNIVISSILINNYNYNK